MRYQGNKTRLGPLFFKTIQQFVDLNNIKTYIEPFVGGGNVICRIKCNSLVGYDINKYLIALLQKVQKDGTDSFIKNCTLEHYNHVKMNMHLYEDWYVGLVAFCCSFNDSWFAGLARNIKGNDTSSYVAASTRNLQSQFNTANSKQVVFKCGNYKDLQNIENAVIYCDPPYKGTSGYKDSIDYEHFYNWCYEMSKNNIVLVSEYNMPSNFKEVLSIKYRTVMSAGTGPCLYKTEKLFCLTQLPIKYPKILTKSKLI